MQFLRNLASVIGLLAMSGACRLPAQVLYGSLTGSVTDSSNAAVPGAKIEALNISTGLARHVVADAQGV